jgi:hypothetical protein
VQCHDAEPHHYSSRRSHDDWFEGNFEAHKEDKKRRLGPEAVMPKRSKYKRLTRT